MDENRFDILWARVKEEFPNAKIINRTESPLMRTIFWIVRHIFRSKVDYNSTFTTTILARMYVPPKFYWGDPDQKYRTLRHEKKHMRQFFFWPMPFLGKIPVLRYTNVLIMGFCYLLVLPAKITLRSKFEREGYTETMLVYVELGQVDPSSEEVVEKFADWMERTFCSGTYFYMMRKGGGARFARTTMRLIADGKITNDEDRVDLAT